jgi:hypothetical protein
MAGIKIKVRTFVRASTIMEVLIAVVLMVTVFGIAMMIFTNVTSNSLSVKKLRAEAILQETLINAEKSANSVSQSFSTDDFNIEQQIKPYNGNPGLTDIHLVAFDHNQQKIAEIEKVILNKNAQ